MVERGFLVIAGLIAAAIVIDVALNDALVSLFLVRKLVNLVTYLEFWH